MNCPSSKNEQSKIKKSHIRAIIKTIDFCADEGILSVRPCIRPFVAVDILHRFGVTERCGADIEIERPCGSFGIHDAITVNFQCSVVQKHRIVTFGNEAGGAIGHLSLPPPVDLEERHPRSRSQTGKQHDIAAHKAGRFDGWDSELLLDVEKTDVFLPPGGVEESLVGESRDAGDPAAAEIDGHAVGFLVSEGDGHPFTGCESAHGRSFPFDRRGKSFVITKVAIAFSYNNP